MTLKALNTRYPKLIRQTAMMSIGLLLVTVSLYSPTQWSAVAEAENSIPALQGAAAITYLKEHKLYDSLRAALNAARIKQGDALVTPVLVEDQKLTASDKALGDEFGRSVAVSGSTVVVGAPFDNVGANNNQGSVYVFNRHGGSWVETQKLTASDGAANDAFGIAVAVSGSTIVVGAPQDSVDGNFLQGSAYVFNRHGGSWVETQNLTASDGGDLFGFSVAVSGSTIVVTAEADTIGDNDVQGSAYVFNRRGGSWIEEQKLTASDGAPNDVFGSSVAVSGSTIVVGAESDTIISANLNQGSAYVFNRRAGGWVETQKLTASDGGQEESFGSAVAIDGATIVVGAYRDDIDGNIDQGSAYVFNLQGGSWVETQKLIASDGAGGTVLVGGDQFGWSVAISGSTIVVGAINDMIGENRFQGSAYVFNRRGGSWIETQKLIASDGHEIDFFGWSVAVSGPTVVVGSPSFVNSSVTFNEGSAYVYEP